MKKIVIVFGSISGLIVAALMIINVNRCYNSQDFESSMFLGYASMLLAFSFIFIGIKSYRDKHKGGIISFGKAFKIGLFICLIASTFYVVAWLVDYYLFIPDFMEKYTTHVLEAAKKSGASAQEMSLQTTEMAGYKEMYKNPFFIILFTYAEILPIGLLVSLISALILKRKSNNALDI